MRCLLGLMICLPLAVQTQPARPKVLGVAHYSIFVSDLAKARAFYEDFLGYEEAFTLPKPDGTVQMAFVKINDHQYLELVNTPNKGEGQLNHLGLYTDDVERMRQYLGSRGVQVPEQVSTNRIGNHKISVTDPDGHTVEIVQYMPDSWTGKDTGKHMPATRISDSMMHAGILVGNLEAAARFYGGILGCHETWRGNSLTSTTLNWVNMRVPDGDNHVEFMLYKGLPAPDRRGSAHHVCLVVPDIQKAVATLEARPARKNYAREMKINLGVDNKRQVGLFDPDGTRVEMMEINPVDGKAAPSSTLPPPRE
ncbi:MAG: VOC family protein [Candidatus Sulfopaludibacter sp.]|nr:VOC family protein [Candidatus Sulfopaludibacter sp.]